jgi:hypothetical protein
MILERSTNPEGDPQAPQGGTPDKSGEELLETVRKRGRGLLHRQKKAAVEELTTVAGVMKDAASKLETTDEAGVGEYVRKAADYMDGLSSTLQEHELDDLLQEWKRILQERPVVCLGLTVGFGFVAGRLLRASSQHLARDVRNRDAEPHAEGEDRP